MRKYTTRGSAELDARIDADLERIAAAASPHGLAGVLLGGYGRGEGTPFINPDGSQAPFNDYDLVVVVDRLDQPVRKKFQALEKQLSGEVGLPVDLCPYLESELPRCEFSLLNYEMKQGHKVVWGAENILSAMPDYPPEALPLSEGTRLLLNRGKLLLDIQRRLAAPAPLSEGERIRFIKFINKVWLAFGDCALLAAGQYDILYAVKKGRVPTLGNCPGRDAVIGGYLKAIELKEWGDFQALEGFDVAQEFEAVRTLFLRFLPWYRQQAGFRPRSVPALVREGLCTLLPKLLEEKSTPLASLFYQLQRRFS